MIEGLYQVDWQNLTHAEGEAANIPALLLGLTSTEPDDRQVSLENLTALVFNQGVVYEATAFVVPFILQLIQNPLVEGKEHLLVFLAQLASGNARFDVLPDTGAAPAGEADQLLRGRWMLERKWAENTRRAVREGIPLYLQGLSHLDPIVRAASAYVLACFPGQGGRIAPQLVRRLGMDHDPIARASIIFSLVVVEMDFQAKCDLLDSLSTGDFDPCVRLAAAMALARVLQENTPAGTVEMLVDFMSALDPKLPAFYTRLPWAENHLFGDLSLVFCQLGPAYSNVVVPDLVRVIDRVDRFSALDIAYTLLYLTFGFERREGNFTTHQIMALEAIAGSGLLWLEGSEMSELLLMFGLPEGPEGIRMVLKG